MNRTVLRSFVTWIVLALLCVSLGGLASRAAAGAERPNVLWITAEDMSAVLGCWGDPYATTPNIDRLARESVKYTRAFASAPVCSPSRSCLITGCYATSLGTQRLRSSFPIPESMKGFPALLRQAGYYCTNRVKTDYNTSNAAAIIRASWDESSAEAHWRKREAGQPFFAVFNHMVSHQSRTMVWPYEQFKKEVQSQLSPEEIHDPARAPVPPYYPDTPVVRKTIARQYDCVTVMDKQVGALLAQLEEDGLAEETIVFFYADHGSGMPRHKRLLLDSGMHVPMLIRFPAKYRHLAPADPGETVDRLVSFVDFGPTVLSLCGIEVPEVMQGVAFLGGGQGKPRRYVYGARDRVDEVSDLARSIHDGRYLYIRNFMPHLSYNQPSAYSDLSEIRHEFYRIAAKGPQAMTPAQWHYAGPTRPIEELYDVEADPMNLNNLAQAAEHRDVLGSMRRDLTAWMRATGDVGFLPEAEAAARSKGTTPFEMRTDERKNPLGELIDAASLVGGGRRAMAEQRKLLADDDPAVRYWAAVGLSAARPLPDRAVGPLTDALEDPAACVRIEAAGALVRAKRGKQALAVLIAALESANPADALHATRTVELLGEDAAAAAAAMRAARQRAEGGGDLKMFIRFSADAFLAGLEGP